MLLESEVWYNYYELLHFLSIRFVNKHRFLLFHCSFARNHLSKFLPRVPCMRCNIPVHAALQSQSILTSAAAFHLHSNTSGKDLEDLFTRNSDSQSYYPGHPGTQLAAASLLQIAIPVYIIRTGLAQVVNIICCGRVPSTFCHHIQESLCIWHHFHNLSPPLSSLVWSC